MRLCHTIKSHPVKHLLPGHLPSPPLRLLREENGEIQRVQSEKWDFHKPKEVWLIRLKSFCFRISRIILSVSHIDFLCLCTSLFLKWSLSCCVFSFFFFSRLVSQNSFILKALISCTFERLKQRLSCSDFGGSIRPRFELLNCPSPCGPSSICQHRVL